MERSTPRLVFLGAAASQIGFYYETGGNVDWRDASAFTTDHDGLMLLLSGLKTVTIVGTALLIVSIVTGPYMYRGAGAVLDKLAQDVRPGESKPLGKPLKSRNPPRLKANSSAYCAPLSVARALQVYPVE
jgi:hypothetical protein